MYKKRPYGVRRQVEKKQPRPISPFRRKAEERKMLTDKLQKMVTFRGLTMRITHNLMQIRNDLYTIAQSHDPQELINILKGYTYISQYSFSSRWETDNNQVALKYGRLTTRP